MSPRNESKDRTAAALRTPQRHLHLLPIVACTLICAYLIFVVHSQLALMTTSTMNESYESESFTFFAPTITESKVTATSSTTSTSTPTTYYTSLTGTFYTDASCTSNPTPFIVNSTTTIGSATNMICSKVVEPAPSNRVYQAQGFCITSNYGGNSGGNAAYYAVTRYANSTSCSSSYIYDYVTGSTPSGMCEPTLGSAGTYVIVNSCTMASSSGSNGTTSGTTGGGPSSTASSNTGGNNYFTSSTGGTIDMHNSASGSKAVIDIVLVVVSLVVLQAAMT